MFLGRRKKPQFLIQTPRGTKDILPDDQKYWRFFEEKATKQVEINGYERIDTPIIERASVFTKSLGETSDVVSKEMFFLKRRNSENNEESGPENDLVLRPEGTAPVVRAYIEHGMQTLPQPIQLYYYGPMFRYERPQKGRLRQHTQFGCESLGSGDPATDARLITLGWNILKDLGLQRLVVKINSLGCAHCRPEIKSLLTNYFSKRQVLLCKDCLERLKINPLRILDCKNPACRDIMVDAPAIVDNLCENCRDEFKQVLEYLDEASVAYDLDPYLVRGLDYYTKTTYEFYSIDNLFVQSALCGGGRYDNLVELYGGRSTPACGWSMGVERIILELKKQKVKIKEEVRARVFVVQLGEMAKKQALGILGQLQKSKIPARAALSKSSIKSQLRMADKLGVDFTLIIGQKEAMDRTVIIRGMNEGVQEVIGQEDLIEKLKEKLARKK